MRKILALIVCTLFFAGQGSSELVVQKGLVIDAQVGDFLTYEIIDLPIVFGEAIDKEKYLRYSDYKTNDMRVQIITKGETMFEGESVDFTTTTTTLDDEFTIYIDDLNDDGDGLEDIVTLHMFMFNEVTSIGSALSMNKTVIADSTVTIININMTLNTFEDQTNLWSSSIERVSNEVINFTGEIPDEIKLGSTWQESTIEKETGTIKDRMCDNDSTDDCEWEYEEIDEEVSVTTTYEVLREMSMDTPAGNFDVLEIKEIRSDEDSGTYSMTYVNDQNLAISMKSYEEDSIFLDAQLKSYKISSLGNLNLKGIDDDNPLPSLPILISLVAMALVASRTRKD
ncbi:hypothetical protein OAK07_00080 [Marine Group III euryarchaeote]|nr:hypothetical protein [Marine Group III euryarchaeote]